MISCKSYETRKLLCTSHVIQATQQHHQLHKGACNGVKQLWPWIDKLDSIQIQTLTIAPWTCLSPNPCSIYFIVMIIYLFFSSRSKRNFKITVQPNWLWQLKTRKLVMPQAQPSLSTIVLNVSLHFWQYRGVIWDGWLDLQKKTINLVLELPDSQSENFSNYDQDLGYGRWWRIARLASGDIPQDTVPADLRCWG
jgi:hypothetical protein